MAWASNLRRRFEHGASKSQMCGSLELHFFLFFPLFVAVDFVRGMFGTGSLQNPLRLSCCWGRARPVDRHH